LAESAPEKNDARKELLEMMGHRSHIDNSVELIGNLLFGSSDGPVVLKTVRAAGEPLVDDWSCLKSTVRLHLTLFGHLSASSVVFRYYSSVVYVACDAVRVWNNFVCLSELIYLFLLFRCVLLNRSVARWRNME
jgi:hypothetical protein